MKYFKNNLTKAHALIFGLLLIVFTVLTYLIANDGIDPGENHDSRVIQTTLSTIAGPLTGAVARGFQDCCLEFSLTVMAYCAPLLILALVVQFITFQDRRGIALTRMGLWTLGWLTWFLGGIVSFGHALL